MKQKLTAPLVLIAFAFSLAGCVFPGYYHQDRYEGGGDGDYNHGPGPGHGPDHGPGGGYYQH